MKKQLTRLLSLVLVLALTLSLFAIIPQSAAAAESANYEEEVYRSLLEQFGGDAEQAQHTLDVMRQVGLLDDENSFYETAKVRLGGELLSLSEVSQRIAEGANLDRTVYVNDYPLPLRDLKTIIEIEEFIQYVKKNYIDNKVELTDEHYRYIGSLASALESGSVMLLGASAEPVAPPSGVIFDDYYLEMTSNPTVVPKTSGLWLCFVRFSIKRISDDMPVTLPYAVSVEWRLLSGSAKAGVHFEDASGIVTIAAGQSAASFTVTVYSTDDGIDLTNLEKSLNSDWRWNGDRVFYIQAYNPQNIHFKNHAESQEVKITLWNDFTYGTGGLTLTRTGNTFSDGTGTPFLATGVPEMNSYAYDTYTERDDIVSVLPVSPTGDLVLTYPLFEPEQLIDGPNGKIHPLHPNIAESGEVSYKIDDTDNNLYNLIAVYDGYAEYSRRVAYTEQNAVLDRLDATFALKLGDGAKEYSSGGYLYYDTLHEAFFWQSDRFSYPAKTEQNVVYTYAYPENINADLDIQNAVSGDVPLMIRQDFAADLLNAAIETKKSLSQIPIKVSHSVDVKLITCYTVTELWAPNNAFLVLRYHTLWPDGGLLVDTEPTLTYSVRPQGGETVTGIRIGLSGGQTALPVRIGYKIPVTVDFSAPVIVPSNTSLSLAVGSKTYYPAEGAGTLTKSVTFLVDVDNTSSLTIGNIKLNNVVLTKNSGVTSTFNLTPVEQKQDSITGAVTVASVSGSLVDFGISIPFNTSPNGIAGWYTSDETEGNYGGKTGVFRFRPFVALVSDGTTKQLVPLYVDANKSANLLVGDFTVPYNETGTAKNYVVEVMYFPQLAGDASGSWDWTTGTAVPSGWYSTGRTGYVAVPPAVFLTADDLAITYPSVLNGLNDTLYLEAFGSTFTLGYTFSKPSATFKSADDFAWSSTNTDVATISANGVVTLTGSSGTVKFTLKALNGGVDGKLAAIESRTFDVRSGLTPNLVIPADEIVARRNETAELRWSSNLTERYADEIVGEDKSVTFEVKIYAASYIGDVLTRGEQVHSGEVVSTLAAFKSGYTIPSGLLNNISPTGGYSYIAEVSALKPNGNPENSGDRLSVSVNIRVLSAPATVTLSRLPSYYLTDDTAIIPLSWTVQNADDNMRLEFEVLKNGISLGLVTDKDTRAYNIAVDTVAGGALKDTYTVTLRVKNPAEDGWSYDSCIIYVYDHNALKLLADGQDVDTYLLSNRDYIESLSPDGIIALNRAITLSAPIGFNKDEYPWGDLTDQFRTDYTTSENAGGLYVFKRGTYTDVRLDTASSYGTKTEFRVFGYADGEVTVTAQHAYAADLADSLGVTVETLRNRLYLFSFLPHTEITITSEQTKEVWTSDSDGNAAIYAKNGLSGRLFLESTYNGVLYRATINADSLQTGEPSPTEAALYPLNAFRLLPAARTELTLTLPDGEPYKGAVTVHAGAFKNGEYCEAAQLNGTIDGTVGTTLNVTDGKLAFTWDETQFTTASSAAEATSADKMEFIYELTFPVTGLSEIGGSATIYSAEVFPALKTVTSGMDSTTQIRTGSAVVKLQTAGYRFLKNMDKVVKPFIANQEAIIGDYAADLAGFFRYLGPNADYDEVKIRTQVLWFGTDKDEAVANRTAKIRDHNGKALDANGLQTSRTFAYPFSTIAITESILTLNTNTVKDWIPRLSARELDIDYAKTSGELVRRDLLPFKAINFTGVESVSDIAEERMDNVLNMFGGTANFDTSGIGTALLSSGIAFVVSKSEGSSLDDNQKSAFNMIIVPTADPTVFRTMISMGIGGAQTMNEGRVYRVDPNVSSSKTPGLGDIIKMAKGTYLDSASDTFDKAASGSGTLGFGMNISAYLEGELEYNLVTQKWELVILSGGGNGVVDLSYKWDFNNFVGPIPVTVQVALGGVIELGLQAAGVIDTDGTRSGEYLTQLRISVYVRVFAGIGFDYAVVALKIGIFGEVKLTAQFAWLNSDNEAAPGNGQKLTLGGKAGIEFLAKLLFIQYKKLFVLWDGNTSKEFNDWKEILDYWENVKNGSVNRGEELVLEPMGTRMLLGAAPQNGSLIPVSSESIVEERDYLGYGGARTGSLTAAPLRRGFGLLSVSTQLMSNAYPYSDPLVSDDGNILVYLSDNNSTDVRNTEIFWANLSGAGQPIDAHGTSAALIGYGDSQITFDGTSSGAAAAWVRLNAGLNKEAGSEITAEEQAMMISTTEIMVSVFNGMTWVTTRLTNDGTPDMAPVIATDGGKAVVAWRSLYASDNTDLTNFDVEDRILYSVYDGTSWSDTGVIYNGTSGSVKGIKAEMIGDKALIVFAADTGSAGANGQEIFYAAIDASGVSEPVQTIIRLTNDGYLDENPQLAAVKLDGNDTSGHFILAWFAQHAVDGNVRSDIRFAAINAATFTPDGDVSDSLIGLENTAITPTFRFVKGAEYLEDLSVLWTEPAVKDGATDGEIVDYDTLKAVKFMRDTYGNSYFTAALELFEAGDYETIDTFDAYRTSDGAIHTILLSSDYGGTREMIQVPVAGTGEYITISLAQPISSIHSVTASYENKIKLNSIYTDYAHICLGDDIPVVLNIANGGIEPITELKVTIGGDETIFTNLNILPGRNRTLTAFYTVPDDRIVNPTYTIEPKFGTAYAGAAKITETLHLDYPDVGVTGEEILTEQDGEREVQFILYNLNDAALESSGRRVKFGLFTDSEGQNSAAGVTITDGGVFTANDILRRIDGGAFSVNATVDIAALLNAVDPVATEIPVSGINVYARVWVEENVGGEWREVAEIDTVNNITLLNFDSLLNRYNNETVRLVSQLDNSGGTSAVNITVANNSLETSSTGNVIATLLDADGKALETLQTFNDGGLISLNGEAVVNRTLTFSATGSNVELLYSDKVMAGSAKLSSLRVIGADVAFDADTLEYGIKMNGKTVLITVLPEDSSAVVSIQGLTAGELSGTLNLPRNRETTVTIEVANGDDKTTYTLTIANGTIGGGNGSFDSTPNGTTTEDGETPSDNPMSVFTDVKESDWFYGDVEYVVLNGLYNGISATKFAPNTPMTRAMLATVLYRLEGEPVVTGANPFSDVKDGQWYTNAIIWAEANGIVDGYGNGRFGTDDNITREQIVTVLYRYARFKGYDVSASADISRFTDAERVSGYALDAVKWANATGLMTGRTATTLVPDGTATRAEVAALLHRFEENIVAENKAKVTEPE